MKFDKDGRLRVFVEGVTISGSGGGSGDVVGPASSTDNAVVRYDGTTGKLIQNSNAILSDAGKLVLSDTITLISGANQYSFPTSDGVSGSLLITDGSGQLVFVSKSFGGNGDVAGPSSSTDNAIARFDGTTGKLIQNSNAILSDSGSLSLSGTITLNSGPNQYIFPTSDSVSGSVLSTDGAGQLVFSTIASSSGSDLGGIVGVELITSTSRVKYSTISGALAAAVQGNSVIVGPGLYNESITIPDGVTLKGYDNSQNVIISGSGATGARVTLGNSVTFRDVTVVHPSDATPAILFTGSTTSVIRTVFFQGNGSGSTGVLVSGSGQVIVSDCVYTKGDCENFLSVESGKIIANTVIILSGTVNTFANVSSSHSAIPSTIVANNMVSLGQAPTVACGFKTNAAAGAAQPSIFASNVNFENMSSAIHMRSNNSRVEIRSSRMEDVTNFILVDSGITGGILHLVGCELEREKINVPDGWLNTADYITIFQDDKPGDKGFIVQSEFSVGMAEKGHESVFGEGDSYTRGMKILTSDSTATSTTEGGNFIDVSVSGSEVGDGLSFGFQGTAANHTIMVCSTLSSDVDKLKYFGIKIKQLIAANEITEKSFICEAWDGTQWSEIKVLNTEAGNFYIYSNKIFIRPNSSEHIRFGIDNTTQWSKKTISGTNGYWVRIRIVNSLTTAPTFDQFKLSSNRFEANADGTNTYHGFSRFRQTIFNTGNVFGETGGVVAYNISVGTGSFPTEMWTHNVKNSEFNGNGDAIYFQTTIPKGTDTSLPLNIRAVFTTNKDRTTGAATIFKCSVLPLATQGILVADPSGAIVPITRSLADADRFDARPALTSSYTIDALDQNKFQTMTFSGFDISNFYQGDVVMFRLEMDNDGPSNVNIRLTTVEASLAKWNNGDRI